MLLGVHGKLTSAESKLAKVNNESAERRLELKRLKDAETERQRAELSESERAKAEAGDWKLKYETELSTRSNLEAKLAFSTVGAADIDSVMLHWNALPAEEREKTTPADFAKTLAKAKPHLFGENKPTDTGPAPGGEGRGGTSPGKVKIDPSSTSLENKKLIKAGWQAMRR